MEKALSNLYQVYDIFSQQCKTREEMDCDKVYRLLNEAQDLLEALLRDANNDCTKINKLLKRCSEYNHYCILYQHFG